VDSSRNKPAYLTPALAAVVMYILGFTGWLVVKLLEMGYDLSTALRAAAVISIAATETAYRLLSWADLSFPPDGGQPPAIA